MSISTSLRRAAKLQEKIDGLRAQLSQLLDRARAEVASEAEEESVASPRRPGRPKMFKSNGRRQVGKRRVVSAKPRTEKPVRAPKAAVAAGGGRRRRRSPLLGVKRAASPSGPLAPAVVAVLKTKHRPMNVADILAGLTANGYQFNSSEPKKNLAARIYRLKGVKQAGAGLFELA